MKETNENNLTKKQELNDLLKRLSTENLNSSQQEKVQELFSKLNNGSSITKQPKKNIFSFLTNFLSKLKFKSENVDTKYLDDIELEINELILSFLSENMFSKDFTKSDQEYPYYSNTYEYSIKRYFQDTFRLEFSDNSLKVYEVSISSEKYEKIKNCILNNSLMDFKNGKSLLEIKQITEETFKKQNEDIKRKCREIQAIEPYYGKISFMSKRIELIRNAMQRLTEHPDFTGRNDIFDYIKFCNEMVSTIEVPTDKMSFDDQKRLYKRYEDFYCSMITIEEKLAPEVGKVWEKRFTKSDKFAEYGSGKFIGIDSILENGKMAFFGHALGQGLFKAENMNKVCCAFLTEKTITVPGDVGLIYPMDMENVLTISPSDAGSWVVNREEFIERGLPADWQFTEPIDEYGNRMFFEDPPTYTKLSLPEDIEQQSINSSIKTNGEMLNNDNHTCYNETILLNKNKKMLPIAVFVKVNGAVSADVLKRAREVSKFYGLPILYMDICQLRQKQGLDPLTPKQREGLTK